MTRRRTLALARTSCTSALLVVLVGCANLAPEAPRNESSSSVFQSYRISEKTPEEKLARTRKMPDRDAPLPLVEIAAPQPLPEPIDLTCETDDLFQRIRNGFSMPDINTDLVLTQQQWYLNHPDYLRRIVERGRLYLHYIVEELDKRGMPMELALLPMVESAYNPMAYSRAKASGLWQFIPATGKRYNLDQDWWKDERRDIVASTSAALDYLQSIYEMHGDWHLALASYNWGEGAVARAINKNRSADLPTDYLSLNMPTETRNYVPKLQALKNIFNNRRLVAELNLPKVPNRPYFDTVVKTENIDVKVAAKLAEIPVQEFVALNPAHNRPVIKSETPIVIPAHKVEVFESNLEAHQESNKPLSSWQTYTLRAGEKLAAIAKRFGLTLASLKSINGFNSRSKPVPGTPLLVPNKNGGETASMAALPEQPRAPEAATEKTPSSRPYTVRKGETLATIARSHRTTVAELKRLNPSQANTIRPGVKLALPARASATTAGKRSDKNVAKAGPGTKNKKTAKLTRYTVRRGDTLASIARHFSVGTDDLKRWNPQSNKTLKPGNTLIIQGQNS